MGVVKVGEYEPLVDDVDDYRPRSSLIMLADPGPAGDRVEGLSLILESCAPGDHIPLHVHPIDELIIVEEGAGEQVLDEVRVRVEAGSVVFIPAGKPHGLVNTGELPIQLRAVFPSVEVVVTYLERNPAPGTEDQAPGTLIANARTGEIKQIPPPIT